MVLGRKGQEESGGARKKINLLRMFGAALPHRTAVHIHFFVGGSRLFLTLSAAAAQDLLRMFGAASPYRTAVQIVEAASTPWYNATGERESATSRVLEVRQHGPSSLRDGHEPEVRRRLAALNGLPP